jgi:hypothetical protein
MSARPAKSSQRIVFMALLAATVLALTGCTLKSTANEQVRLAYMAGQRDALAQMQGQSRGGSVTFVGPVNNRVVAWSQGFTLAKAIVDAGYNSQIDPLEIVIHRTNSVIQIDPKRLLSGDDFPLQPGDIVEFQLPPK